MEPFQLSLFDPSFPTKEEDDIEARAEQLADWVIQEMEKEGLNRAAQQQFLMRLQIKTLVDQYLAKTPPQHRWQFVVRLISAIQALEQNPEGC
ncbi:hypothetical protein ACQ4M4_11000 [Leptolyngbya sp. AN02str]|uniref:hypothetical protein n=1 Tax=Leptolyngbya sp. AN02str TaxID=3423363 RepID=UPI003D315288